MESFITIYKNGQFYLKDGDKLVTPLNNTELVLVVEDESTILIEDSKAEQQKPLSSVQKEQQVKRGSDRHAKILSAGENLFFEVKVGNIKRPAVAVVLEDLYLYDKINWKTQEAKLFPCICQMVEMQAVEVKEPITASSISDLYKRTYIHYNGNNGSPAANALITFFVKYDDRRAFSLDELRQTTVFKNSSEK